MFQCVGIFLTYFKNFFSGGTDLGGRGPGLDRGGVCVNFSVFFLKTFLRGIKTWVGRDPLPPRSVLSFKKI